MPPAGRNASFVYSEIYRILRLVQRGPVISARGTSHCRQHIMPAVSIQKIMETVRENVLPVVRQRVALIRRPHLMLAENTTRDVPESGALQCWAMIRIAGLARSFSLGSC